MWRCSAPPTSFAAAARRSGSRRITIGYARCSPRRLPPTPCAGSTASWCRRSSSSEATTARRCSSTIAAPATPTSASIQAGLAAAKAGAALAFDRAAALLPARAGADAGVARRGGMERRTRHRARQRGAAGRGGRSLPPRGRARQVMPREWSSNGAAAEQFLIGGHIDRGVDLIRSVLASVGIRACPEPARRAAVVVVAAPAASLARPAVRFKACRRNRRRCPPPRGHLLVGDDRIGVGGRDQRLGFQRASPAHGARCRRTVSYLPRDGDRVSRQRRVCGGPKVERETGRAVTDTGEQRRKPARDRRVHPGRRHQCDALRANGSRPWRHRSRR